jgi:adrenodoxin-NADP+ reductase
VTWDVTKLPAAKLDPSASLGGSVENTTTWGAGTPPGGSPSALSTGKQETTQTDLLISSIGYRSEQISDAEPFDSGKAIVPNDAGRVKTLDGTRIPGQYVSGWLARGPVGVIASTMYDAYSVADLLVQDHKEGISLGADCSPAGLPAELARPSRKVVTYRDWMRLDELERERGAKLGKLREKILSEWFASLRNPAFALTMDPCSCARDARGIRLIRPLSCKVLIAILYPIVHPAHTTHYLNITWMAVE